VTSTYGTTTFPTSSFGSHLTVSAFACQIASLGVTYVSETDDTDPVFGVKCVPIKFGGGGDLPATSWTDWLKLLKNLVKLFPPL
jgi:hypothetical protein